MNTFLQAIERWLKGPGDANRPEPTVTVRRQYVPSSPSSRRPGSRILVKRTPRPYWEERGWRNEGGIYTGNYQTPSGSCPGYVTVSPSGRIEVFIHNPPSVLQRHPHWECFQHRKDGWYFVHPVWPVADVSAGILGVEKTIAEAYEL